MYPLLEIYLIDTWTTVEAVNIGSLNQSEANLKTGTLTLGWDLSLVPDLGKDDAVAVRVKQDATDAGTVIFSGKITARSSNGTTVTYTASNVLNDLSRIVMVVGGETAFDLFRDADGEVLNIGEQIEAALDYAAAQGIDVTYIQTEIDALSLDMPATEVSDLTVYEVLKKTLTYRSDILVAVQYAAPGSDSTLRLVDQSDLTDETLVIGTDISTYSAKALYDQQINGVVLNYSWVDVADDGKETFGSASDNHGIVTGVNVLRQKLKLTGRQPATEYEGSSIECPTGSSSYEDKWNFWRKAYTLGAEYDGNFSYPISEPWDDMVRGDTYNIGGGTHLLLKSFFDAQDAFTKASIGPVFDPDCYCSRFYIDYGGNGSGVGNKWFDYGYITSVDPDITGDFWLPFYAFTPNSTGFYGAVGGDAVPTDLAEQLYNILSPLQYDGQVICYDDLTTPTRICSILRKLNIAGADTDYETMAAVVQKSSSNLLSGTRTDTFGVASHLEPQDFIALCRANKTLSNLRLA